MADDHVTLDVHDAIATLTMRNPGRRNALTWRMYDDLAAHTASLAAREDVRVVIVQGTPEDGFAAGTDISQFTDFHGGEDGVAYERRVGGVLASLAELPVPVIASVRGAAVGAGLAIALSCDLIVAERGAVFGAPIVRTVGNVLPANVVRLMLASLGQPTAKAMLLGARLIPAEELSASGALFGVEDDVDLDESVQALAGRIRGSAPLSLRSLKAQFARAIHAVPLPADDDLIITCYGSEDFRRGVAAFTSKTKPDWTGR